MSLSSKLKKQTSVKNILSPDTAARTIKTLQDVQAKMSAVHEIEDEELELPKLDLEPLVVQDESKENYDHILFITDYKLTDDVAKSLDKFLNIRNFEEDSFKNRDLAYLAETNINYIWVCLHQPGARTWIRKNINKTGVYKTIASYAIKNQAWVNDISEYVDITVSKRNLKDVSFLTLGELLDEVRAQAIKIHPPIKGCLDKILFKNRLVQQKKN